MRRRYREISASQASASPLRHSETIPGRYASCIWRRSLPGFPRFPEALESKKQHDGRGEENQKKTARPDLGCIHVFSIFLNRGENKQDSEGQENSANKFQPQVTQCFEEIPENDL